MWCRGNILMLLRRAARMQNRNRLTLYGVKLSEMLPLRSRCSQPQHDG